MLFIYPCLLLGDLWDISSSTQYYDSGVILGSLWGFSGVTLAILWGHFIDTLWSHWGYNWITLGISMGSLWRYSGGNFWLRPWSEPNKSDCHFLPPSLPLADSSILSLVLTGPFLCHLCFCLRPSGSETNKSESPWLTPSLTPWLCKISWNSDCNSCQPYARTHKF